LNFQVCNDLWRGFHNPMYFFNTFSVLVTSFLGLCHTVSGEIQHQEVLFENFKRSMDGVRFTGFFTMDGTDTPPSQETYEVQNVQKFGDGDLWIFTARIKYGKKDITLPMPLPVKWLGDIPVISMKNLSIPGLGSFSAHVVIDGNKYAGTWAHGKVSGHLYGNISKFTR